MKSCVRLFASALLLLCVAAPSHAQRSLPVARALQLPVQRGTSTRTAPSCALGVTDPAVYVVSYVIPPDDQYFTLLDAGDTDCSGSGGVQLTEAHLAVEFSYGYETPVRVSVVRADLSDPECPKPIPGSYLCPPTDYMLSAPSGGAWDLALPLPATCSLAGKAFLEITFTEWGFSYETPALLLTGGCEPCTSFNYYPGNHYDLCSYGFEGNPIMYAVGLPESVVPVRAGTWGRLKLGYR
ncbi:MAG: hypothetical protein U0704_08585 [Candidatus Eisenbacteria bacterium]